LHIIDLASLIRYINGINRAGWFAHLPDVIISENKNTLLEQKLEIQLKFTAQEGN
jgi:hypothetical protein